MKSKIKKIYNHIFNDYFMPNRYKEYEKIIKNYKEEGYNFITISEYKKLKNKGKYIIIRHDIDSDIPIAKEMFNIERKYEVKTTYYFRKSTFDIAFMKEINKYGSEVGYHYEEIATYIKKNKIKSKDQVLNHLDKIKKMLENNIKDFQEKVDFPIKSIAAHGDYINAKFKIINTTLFDQDMQNNFPDIIEAYDPKIEKNLDARISDCVYPEFWKPKTPEEILKNKNEKVLMLIHTRWWNKAPLRRTKLLLQRIIEEAKYKYF